jgi:RNA polymerase sigma factor (sigma-70 family)
MNKKQEQCQRLKQEQPEFADDDVCSMSHSQLIKKYAGLVYLCAIEHLKKQADNSVLDKNDYAQIGLSNLKYYAEKYKSTRSPFMPYLKICLSRSMMRALKRQEKFKSEVQYFSGMQLPVDLNQQQNLDLELYLSFLNNQEADVIILEIEGYKTGEICTKLDMPRNIYYAVRKKAIKQLQSINQLEDEIVCEYF